MSRAKLRLGRETLRLISPTEGEVVGAMATCTTTGPTERPCQSLVTTCLTCDVVCILSAF